MKRVSKSEDIRWMKTAIDLAGKGGVATHPNPNVGAVVVKDGRIIGSGYHHKAGKAHAEVLAIKQAGRRAKGATLYVSLEPCSTWGKTGPCTDAIIRSGIRRVVLPVRDPNPKNRGRGRAILRKHGIAVTEGVLQERGSEIIAPFAKWITTGLPFVTLKMAMSMDGRIADAKGRSRWISSEAARKWVHARRQNVDAILIGTGTVQADNPRLHPEDGDRYHPYRVVIDSRGRIPMDSTILIDKFADRTIIATTSRCPGRVLKTYEETGAKVLLLPEKAGRVSLSHLLRALGRMGILRVFCEGGATLAYNLIEGEHVDELLLFIAPIVLGHPDSVPLFRGQGWLLEKAPRFVFRHVEQIGQDFLVRATPEAS